MPAHQVHQLLADTQTQPGAAMFGGRQRAALDKRPEHSCLLFDADAGASIFDAQVQVFVTLTIHLAGDTHTHISALRELQRIAQKVMHDLAQAQRVEPVKALGLGIERQGQVQALFLRSGFKQALDTFEETFQVSGLWRQLQMAGFDLRQIKAISHQGNQLPCRAMGHLQRLGNRGARGQGALLFQLQQADNRRHRRTNLMTEVRHKGTLGVVRFIGSATRVHQLGFQDLALVDIDPAPEQTPQLALGIVKRHGPLIDMGDTAVELQLAVDKQRLLRLQLLHVPHMQAQGGGGRQNSTLRQGQALDQFKPGGQLLFIAFVAGDQTASEVTHKHRVGHAIEQGALERQLVIEPSLGLHTLANLTLEPAVPDQRYQHKQQRRGDRPIGPWRHTLPGGHRDRHRAHPAQAQRAQFGYRQGFQGLVQNTQQLGMVLAHCQVVTGPLAIDTATDPQLIGRITLHLDFTLDGRCRVSPGYQGAGLGVVGHRAQADLRVFTPDVAFEHMPRRQRQHLARKLAEAGQRWRIKTLDKHPAGTAKAVAEIQKPPAFGAFHQGSAHIRTALFQDSQGLRGGKHFLHDELQTGHARQAIEQIDIQPDPAPVLVFEHIGRVLLGRHHHMGMLQHPGLLGGRQGNTLTDDVHPQPGGPTGQDLTAHRVINALQRPVHHLAQQGIGLARGEGKTNRRQAALLLDLHAQVRTQGLVGAHDHFIADKRIHITLLQGFEAAIEIGRQHDVALRVGGMHVLDVGVAIEQHHLLVLECVVWRGIGTAGHHHRTVGHIVRRKGQAGHVTFIAVGAGEDINRPGAQGLHGLGPLGEAHHLHRHAESRPHQAQVVGTDTLVAIAIAGDVDGLVVINGNPHPQGSVLRQPLPLGGCQGDGRQGDKRRHQIERQADGGQACRQVAEQQRAQ